MSCSGSRFHSDFCRHCGAGQTDAAVAKLKEAAALEYSIDDLSQPPYPVIPANEVCGNLLLELNRPADASVYFHKALKRTPNRPRVVLGLARAAQAQGDKDAAAKQYAEFLAIWRTADSDRPELAQARKFLSVAKMLSGVNAFEISDI